jgi:hypothetical protein
MAARLLCGIHPLPGSGNDRRTLHQSAGARTGGLRRTATWRRYFASAAQAIKVESFEVSLV